MQASIKTINATGLKEIHAFLAENHKLGGEHFTPAMLRAWAEEAEFSLAECNDAGIEIKPWDSVWGRTQTFTVSDAGIDTQFVEIEDDMKKYEVSANGQIFGTYEADSEQAARDLCAQDAGYKSEDDMVKQLEQSSELVAVAVEDDE